MRSMVCCHVGRPTTFLNAVVAAAFATEAAIVRLVMMEECLSLRQCQLYLVAAWAGAAGLLACLVLESTANRK